MDEQSLADALRRLRLEAALLPEEVRRGYKRVTQELLAERLGWANAAHVSEIENSKRQPDRFTIERWVKVCGGTSEQEHYAQGLAGNVPLTKLPAADQIVAVLSEIDQDTLRKHPYPAYMLDYRNTIWAFNGACDIFLQDGESLKTLLQRRTNLFQLMFDHRLPLRRSFVEPDDLYRSQIRTFKQINLVRQHEPFYRRLPESVTSTLTDEDATLLGQYWSMPAVKPSALHRNRVVVRVDDGSGDGLVINFLIRAEYVYNYANIFGAVCLEPDPDFDQDIAAIDAAFAPFQGRPSSLLWDEVDIHGLVEDYNADLIV